MCDVIRAWAWAWLVWWAASSLPPAAAGTPFTVYWNVPSQQCAKYGVHVNVSQYGLVQNTGDAFYGDKMSIVYNPGAFPYLDKDGAPVNGGIPQNGSLTTHVQTFINRINKQIPENFSGAAVLDFESYYPSLDMSVPAYREASRAWVRAQHPTWPQEKIDQEATATFNQTVRDYFQVLLWVGRELRPGALWGYYHYPYCHNYAPGEGDCKPGVMQHNDDTLWLYERSAALYPSIYVFKNSGFDPPSRRLNAQGRILEALRMRRRAASSAPILPYFWYRYHDSASFLSPVDVLNTLGLTRVMGLEGAVIWGAGHDMATKEQCLGLKSYAEGKLGPLVRYLARLPRAKLRPLISSRARLKRRSRRIIRKAKMSSRNANHARESSQRLPAADNRIQ